MALQIEPLSRAHNRKDFSCAREPLNVYLAKTARQHQDKNISRTFVLVDDQAPRDIVGYVTIVVCEADAPPGSELYNRYPYRLPALKLARMAVDERYAGHDYGALLVIEAIRRTVTVALSTGLYGLFVDAKDEAAATYYEKFGFLRVDTEPDGEGGDNPPQLWLPLKTCEAIAAASMPR